MVFYVAYDSWRAHKNDNGCHCPINRMASAPPNIEEVGMGNQDSLLVDISNNLDDIRKELRIANQLKIFDLVEEFVKGGGLAPELHELRHDLLAKLNKTGAL